jgi:hypothetical protein
MEASSGRSPSGVGSRALVPERNRIVDSNSDAVVDRFKATPLPLGKVSGEAASYRSCSIKENRTLLKESVVRAFDFDLFKMGTSPLWCQRGKVLPAPFTERSSAGLPGVAGNNALKICEFDCRLQGFHLAPNANELLSKRNAVAIEVPKFIRIRILKDLYT